MYKIFFLDRCLTVSDKPDECLTHDNELIYKIKTDDDLSVAIEAFEQAKAVKNFCILCADAGKTFERLSSSWALREAGGGLVRNVNGEVLIIFRNGRWDLPKGKREAGEEMQETAVREVQEECGISKPEIDHFLCDTYHVYTEDGIKKLKKTTWFSMTYKGNEQPHGQIEEGITDVKWASKENLSSCKLNTFRSILEVLHVAGL